MSVESELRESSKLFLGQGTTHYAVLDRLVIRGGDAIRMMVQVGPTNAHHRHAMLKYAQVLGGSPPAHLQAVEQTLQSIHLSSLSGSRAAPQENTDPAVTAWNSLASDRGDDASIIEPWFMDLPSDSVELE